jgi:hypothetical protein
MTLKHLGEARAEMRDKSRARASLAEALKIFQQIDDQAEAAETTALLASLAGEDR